MKQRAIRLAACLVGVSISTPCLAETYYNPYLPFGVSQSDAIALPASGMELIGPIDAGTTNEIENGLVEQLDREIAQQKEQELVRHMTWEQYQEYKRNKKTGQ